MRDWRLFEAFEDGAWGQEVAGEQKLCLLIVSQVILVHFKMVLWFIWTVLLEMARMPFQRPVLSTTLVLESILVINAKNT